VVSDLDYSEKFVLGRGVFVDDIKQPDTLYLKVVRSPYARARVLRVKGGINGRDFKAVISSVGEGATQNAAAVPMPVLATDYVNFVGQPVAAVFGETRYEAEDLAESVEVDYEPLPPVIDPTKALTSPPIHPNTRSNILSKRQLGSDFHVETPIILKDKLSMERVAANPIEPRGVLANYDGSKLTVWASTQSVHSLKEGIRSSLQLPSEVVRVMQADTGGAFGTKSSAYPEYLIAAHVAIKTRRPVKWIETRSEHLLTTSHGRGERAEVELYAQRDGVVVGVKAKVLGDAGAYAGFGSFAPSFIGFQLTGPYAVKNAYVDATSVYTNKVPMGPYRGAGRPEAAFFMERMMDMLADELKMDPVDLRFINTSTQPFRSPLGLEIGASKPFLQSAVEELRYRERAKSGKAGFSFFVLVSAARPGESARIMVKDGRVRVWLGGNSHGQAHEVLVKKLVSEELNLSEDLIDLEKGDTDHLKTGVGSWGSRTTAVGGAALVEAARRLRKEATESIGATLGPQKYSPENLLKGEFNVEVFREQTEQLNSFGANLVVADVDEDSGIVSVKECASFYDVGRALNPAMIVGQIHGGSAQGIGQVLYEEIKYDEQGQLLTGTIMDTGVPHPPELPNFEVIFVENPSNLPHGAKGVGESPTIGVPAALVRAIEKASGKRITETPVKSEVLLRNSSG
jgi:carbon-monoxide dehydrogenase large subunit